MTDIMKTTIVTPQKVHSGSLAEKNNNPHVISSMVDRELSGDETTIPKLSTLVDDEMAEQIKSEVEEYTRLKRDASTIESRIKELKSKFEGVVAGCGVPTDKGFFIPDHSTVIFREQQRTALSEDELLKHIGADVLESCRKPGPMFTVLTIKAIKVPF